MNVLIMEGAGEWLITLIPVIAIFAIFYFFLIRPEAKREKKRKEFVEALKKGDRVVTIGGIMGRVTGVSDNYVIIESENTRLKVLKNAISMEHSLALNQKGKEKEAVKEKEKQEKGGK